MVDASLLSYRTGRYGIILTAVWTMIAAASLAWNLWQQSHDMVETARVYARAAFERDVLFRAWNAGHGGVYVPVTEASPPNPHLRAPERDIVTPSGRLLTLINPSYMTRQIHEMGRERTMITGHITSLDPIRPANAPDDWERRALEAFERGVDEVSEITMLDGEAHLRLMQPLITERACLACHRQQGYSEGDIRGGISESVHLAPLQDMRQSQARLVAGAHGLLWLLGMAGIVFGTRRLTRVHEMLRKLSRAIEQSPATVLVTDTEGRIEYVNPQFTRVTGYMPDEVLGQNPRILKSGHATDAEYRALWDTLTAGEVWRGEFHNKRKDGGVFWEAASISPVKDADGRITNYVAVKEDVTERKKAETELRAAKAQAEAANLTKSQFLATVSHELRTPLNAIIGFSELMEQELFGPIGEPHYRGYVHDIRSSGSHLLGLIDDILDLAKIEAGTLRLKEQIINVGTAIRASLDMMRPQADSGGVSMRCEIARDLPDMRADDRAMRQIMLNLLSNAVKFTPPGGTVTVCAGQDDDGALLLSVADTGIGIAPENIAKVLEPFGQVDSSMSRRFQGTGLGLPLARSLTQMQGGVFAIDSTPDIGTTVTLRFPEALIVRPAVVCA